MIMSEVFKTLSEIRKLDIIEFIMVLEGIKPSMFAAVDKNDMSELEKICKNLGLFINFEAISTDYKDDSVNNRDAVWFSVSKDGDISKSVLEELKRSAWSPELARLLGYPNCCYKFYIKLAEDEKLKDLIHHTYKNTKSKLNLYLNNVFNYTSRLQGKTDRLFRIHLLNKEMHLPFYKFTAHAPCSYDCQRSIEIGKKTQSSLKKHGPELAKEIYTHLSKPILFFDDFRWVLFNGYARGNSIFYESIIKPHSFLVNEPIYKKFLSGNRVSVFDDRIEVLKNGKKICEIKKKSKSEGFVLDFKDQDGENVE
ncbi:MAG: hypothetical protein JSV39_03265 [Candidatus Aenigmatarchaeota archaeon]|nr:MAG: hypothetical protein JSV39_03265 [Candidatus Aenigmarchaeota archaeon]